MDPIRAYDRTVNRLSRRELLKIAGSVGLAAIARPIAARQTLACPLFLSYPFTLGVASGDPMSDGVVLWTRLAPDPLNGGGMPAAPVEVGWEVATDPGFRDHRPDRHRARAAGVRPQRPCRAPGPPARPEVLVPLPRRRGGQPDRPHHDGAGRRRAGQQAPLRGLRLQPLRDRLFHRLPPDGRGEIRLRFSHRRLHLRKPGRRRPAPIACASTTARRSTPSSTTGTATRCTRRTPTSRRSTPPLR